MESKKCVYCGKEYISKLPKNRGLLQKYCSIDCKEKARTKRRKEQGQFEYKGKCKNRKLKKRYGLTLNEYNNIINQQNSKCKICGKESKLVVDHDHSLGYPHYRGIICFSCNNVLGLVNDDPQILENIIQYLKDWKGGDA